MDDDLESCNTVCFIFLEIWTVLRFVIDIVLFRGGSRRSLLHISLVFSLKLGDKEHSTYTSFSGSVCNLMRNTLLSLQR